MRDSFRDLLEVFDNPSPARNFTIEHKSLKLYLQAFRNEGIFYEAVTNRIMDDFLAVVKPRRATVESRWTPRGGLHSNIIVTYPEAK